MIAALPGADGFNQLLADVQAVAPLLAVAALVSAALLNVIPTAVTKKAAKGLFAGSLVLLFVVSGLALAWINYFLTVFGGKGV